jgi:hypothetical protein
MFVCLLHVVVVWWWFAVVIIETVMQIVGYTISLCGLNVYKDYKKDPRAAEQYAAAALQRLGSVCCVLKRSRYAPSGVQLMGVKEPDTQRNDGDGGDADRDNYPGSGANDDEVNEEIQALLLPLSTPSEDKLLGANGASSRIDRRSI